MVTRNLGYDFRLRFVKILIIVARAIWIKSEWNYFLILQTNQLIIYLMIAWVQISPSIPSFNVKLAISWIFRLSTLGLLNCFLFIYLFIYLFVRAGISSFVTSLNWQWDIGNVDKGFLISHVVEYN